RHTHSWPGAAPPTAPRAGRRRRRRPSGGDGRSTWRRRSSHTAVNRTGRAGKPRRTPEQCCPEWSGLAQLEVVEAADEGVDVEATGQELVDGDVVEAGQALEPGYRDGPLAPLVGAEDRRLELLGGGGLDLLEGQALLLANGAEPVTDPAGVPTGHALLNH